MKVWQKFCFESIDLRKKSSWLFRMNADTNHFFKDCLCVETIWITNFDWPAKYSRSVQLTHLKKILHTLDFCNRMRIKNTREQKLKELRKRTTISIAHVFQKVELNRKIFTKSSGLLSRRCEIKGGITQLLLKSIACASSALAVVDESSFLEVIKDVLFGGAPTITRKLCNSS